MKIKLLLIALSLTQITHLSAQEKRDYIWLSGRFFWGYNPLGTMLDFNTHPLNISELTILGSLGESTVMSDTSGQLLFYSDGCMVTNRQHQMMENGDSLNLDIEFEQSCIVDSIGHFLDHGIIALPYPDHPNLYVLYHLTRRDYEESLTITHLLYSIIDMDTPDGLGRVVVKNQELMEGDFMDGITAVRHGNGRDWWVVVPEFQGNHLLTHLLSPEGPGPTAMVPTDASFANQSRFRSQLVFSPDGTKFARAGANGEVVVIDFDRCTGTYSNWKQHIVKKYAGAGVAFSPNSRFLYVSTGLYLHQIDVWADTPVPVLVGEWDGFSDPFPSVFFQQRLAPDGKIYMSNGNGIRYLHCINAPDSAGLACDLRQHSIQLFNSNTLSLNNFPYYNLYDFPHSPCDTLGINAPPGIRPAPSFITQEGISIQPNPTSDWLYLTVGPGETGQLRIFFTNGQLLYENLNLSGPERLEIITKNWPVGVYFLHWGAYGKQQVTKKLLIVR
jgi:WD40 repeat protein